MVSSARPAQPGPPEGARKLSRLQAGAHGFPKVTLQQDIWGLRGDISQADDVIPQTSQSCPMRQAVKWDSPLLTDVETDRRCEKVLGIHVEPLSSDRRDGGWTPTHDLSPAGGLMVHFFLSLACPLSMTQTFYIKHYSPASAL